MEKTWMNPESPISKYLQWAEAGKTESAEDRKATCFFSVILCTEGKQPEKLQDVLCCLQGQRDQDYELILVCKGNEEGEQGLRKLIGTQSVALQQKTRIIIAPAEKTDAAMNAGLAIAGGEYFIFLSEDDLLFENWVETFHRAAQVHPGMILRAYALTQGWEEWTEANGQQMITAQKAPEAKDCIPFQLRKQAMEGMTLEMGVAFPAFISRELGFCMEDGQEHSEIDNYLLRVLGITGLHDTEETVGIHREWHGKADQAQEERKLDWKIPMILSGEESADIWGEMDRLRQVEAKGRSVFLREATLFWGSEEGFADGQNLKAAISIHGNRIETRFNIVQAKSFSHFRIDPGTEALFGLRNVCVELYCQNRLVRRYGIEDMASTNGFIEAKTIIFLDTPPRMEFDCPRDEEHDCIQVSAEISYEYPATWLQCRRNRIADQQWEDAHRNLGSLYLDRGQGLSVEDMVTVSPVFDGTHYAMEADIPDRGGQPVLQMRFDPTELGMVSLEKFEISIRYASGRVQQIVPGEIRNLNGIATREGYAFLERDPWMMLPLIPGEQPIHFSAKGEIRFLKMAEIEQIYRQKISEAQQETERAQRALAEARQELSSARQYGAEMAAKVGEMENTFAVKLSRKLHGR